MRLTDELDLLILAAVCNDFRPLEFIADNISRVGRGTSGAIDTAIIQSHLQKLVSDKLINACLIHADPPYITAIAISPDAVSTSWFYITQRGNKCLDNLSRKRAEEHRRDAKSPDRKDYTSAVKF